MPAPIVHAGYHAEISSILRILGTTKAHLWPFIESEGITVAGHGAAEDLAVSEAGAAEALEDDFSPIQYESGVHSYNFNPVGDHHLNGPDHANYSFGDGSTDDAFSLGAWIWPSAIASNAIIAKYDSAGNAEEYRFWIDGSGNLALELHDASASTTETGTGGTVLTLFRPVHVVATYDGTETAPEVHIYIDAVDDLSAGTTTESGLYVAMENTATPLTIGCAGVTATPTLEFNGRIALPFLCGKALSQAEINDVYHITKSLLL